VLGKVKEVFVAYKRLFEEGSEQERRLLLGIRMHKQGILSGRVYPKASENCS
jgi:hypothetical protein